MRKFCVNFGTLRFLFELYLVSFSFSFYEILQVSLNLFCFFLDGIAGSEEDWDKELEESMDCVDNSFSVGVEVTEVEQEKRNEFLSLLTTYPPASQAFTSTATYNSLVVCRSFKNYDNNNLYNTCNSVQQAIFIQGQFDDADWANNVFTIFVNNVCFYNWDWFFYF